MEGEQFHFGNTGKSNETTEEEANIQVIPEAIDLSNPYDLFFADTEEEAQEDYESFRDQWLGKNEQAMTSEGALDFYTQNFYRDYVVHLQTQGR